MNEQIKISRHPFTLIGYWDGRFKTSEPKEWESAVESWASMSVRDRYELIKRSGNCSVFAARHAYMPDDDRVQEILRSWA